MVSPSNKNGKNTVLKKTGKQRIKNGKKLVCRQKRKQKQFRRFRKKTGKKQSHFCQNLGSVKNEKKTVKRLLSTTKSMGKIFWLQASMRHLFLDHYSTNYTCLPTTLSLLPAKATYNKNLSQN